MQLEKMNKQEQGSSPDKMHQYNNNDINNRFIIFITFFEINWKQERYSLCTIPYSLIRTYNRTIVILFIRRNNLFNLVNY